MSWVKARDYFKDNDVAILPVGSNEQHGPQNPLGTDHLIAKAIAEETARRTGLLCLPVIPFGISSHHKQFYGTIFLSSATFKAYVKEVCLSLLYYGVTKIVVVNGHGGNLNALMEMSRELRQKGVFVSVFQWWDSVNEVLPSLFEEEEKGHAAAEETSVNLALYPNIVDMGKAVDVVDMSKAVDEYSRSGVFGRSTSASAEKGRKVFEAVVSKLVEHVKLVKASKIEDLLEKSKV